MAQQDWSTVGKPVRKKDAMALLLGRPAYLDDLTPKDCLVVKVLRSPHAHALIEEIDTENAEQIPGVAAIFTYRDVPQKRFTMAGQTYPEPSPYDRLILDRRVRFVGDAVAIVAGENEAAVDRALKRIRVRYQVLEPVLDFHTAKDNLILVHPEESWRSLCPVGADNRRNLCASETCQDGDVDRILAGCDQVVEGVYHTKACQQAMMETFRTYTEIDRKENRDEIRIQRKFETASMGVTVFVHSIKNQLLSNRVLCKKIRRELAAEQPDMEKLREYACMLEQFNENMLGRMEELYKSIKSNALILSPIPAGQVVTQAIRQFQQKYRGVSVDVLGDQDEVILADVQHLGEAVYNLLTNAHEAFLVSGKTEKEILQIILHSERFYIGFEIRDNGNGIAEKERQKIFYPFYTSKNTNNNWGMGLYYVREIVKGHFGMMKMESVPGEGTSFCMMIPRYEPRKRLNLKWKRGEV